MKKYLTAGRHVVTIEGHSLPIVIRKHPSSRKIVIRYLPLTHSLGLTLPRYASIRQGLHFIEEKRNWIAAQLRERAQKTPFADGQIIPVLGQDYTLTHMGGRGVVRTEEHTILVPGEIEFMARRVRDWLVARAREEITQLAPQKALLIGKSIGRIGLRDTSSHWGSCNQDGNLSFSWRLVLAPREVLEYVVCHEVAHLAELNHSAAFWTLVAKLYPNWRTPKNWLKAHGSELYKFG